MRGCRQHTGRSSGSGGVRALLLRDRPAILTTNTSTSRSQLALIRHMQSAACAPAVTHLLQVPDDIIHRGVQRVQVQACPQAGAHRGHQSQSVCCGECASCIIIQHWVRMGIGARLADRRTPHAVCAPVRYVQTCQTESACPGPACMVHSCAAADRNSIHTHGASRHEASPPHWGLCCCGHAATAESWQPPCIFSGPHSAVGLLQTQAAAGVICSHADTAGAVCSCTRLLRHIQTGKRCMPAAATMFHALTDAVHWACDCSRHLLPTALPPRVHFLAVCAMWA